MGCRSWLLIGVFLLALAPAHRARSQVEMAPPQYVVDQYYRATTRTIDIVLDDIRNVLDASGRDLFDQIDFRVNRDDWNVYGVFASRNGSGRTVEVSIGFVIALDHVDTALVAAELSKLDHVTVMSYLQEFVLSIYHNIERMRRGEKPLPAPAFAEFAGWSPTAWQNLVADPRFGEYKDAIKLNSMALIMGHEISHHLLGHLNNTTSSVEEEMAADVSAVNFALRSGYTPLLAATSFLFFAALEGDTGIYDGTGTHPPPLCRFVFLVREGIEDALDDSAFIAHLRETGQYESWFARVERLEGMDEDAGLRCP